LQPLRHVSGGEIQGEAGQAREGQWNWFWMTQADWYDTPPYSDHSYWFSGTAPNSFEEMRQRAEWWSVYWDDFNWEDPTGSVLHDFEQDEIIGLTGHVFDSVDKVVIPHPPKINRIAHPFPQEPIALVHARP